MKMAPSLVRFYSQMPEPKYVKGKKNTPIIRIPFFISKEQYDSRFFFFKAYFCTHRWECAIEILPGTCPSSCSLHIALIWARNKGPAIPIILTMKRLDA
jgi:hypothetical protein